MFGTGVAVKRCEVMEKESAFLKPADPACVGVALIAH